MKKIIPLGSLLLGVVFLSGCGQQSVSQTQPTTPAPVAQAPATKQPVTTQPVATFEGGKVYQNTKYKYTFSYPTNLVLDKMYKADSQDVSIGEEPIINISVNNSSIDDGTGKCPKEYYLKSLIVDNQNVEICDGAHTKRFDFYATFIPKDSGNTIFIEATGGTDKKPQTREFFEKFISSFKFTK